MDHIGNIISDYQNNNLGTNVLPVDPPKLELQLEPKQTFSINTEELKKKIYILKDQIDSIIKILENGKENKIIIVEQDISSPNSQILNSEKIIEGVFNGEKMIGPDGKEYAIPQNYASKSKLIEGDLMKLIIAENGRFIFKQIGPAKRKRLVGKLNFESDIQRWVAVTNNDKKYKVLTASITFFHGKPNDEAVIIVPENEQSDWAAVENLIIK